MHFPKADQFSVRDVQLQSNLEPAATNWMKFINQCFQSWFCVCKEKIFVSLIQTNISNRLHGDLDNKVHQTVLSDLGLCMQRKEYLVLCVHPAITLNLDNHSCCVISTLYPQIYLQIQGFFPHPLPSPVVEVSPPQRL